MPTFISNPNNPPNNPKNAVQQKARRNGFHILGLGHFAAHRNTTGNALGHVLIFDLMGEQLAGPMSVADADAWLAAATSPNTVGGAS